MMQILVKYIEEQKPSLEDYREMLPLLINENTDYLNVNLTGNQDEKKIVWTPQFLNKIFNQIKENCKVWRKKLVLINL